MLNQSFLLGSFSTLFFLLPAGVPEDCNNNGIADDLEIQQENYLFHRVETYNPVANANPNANVIVVKDTAVDSGDNLIICGMFKGSVDFNPGEATDLRTSSAPSSFDLFITKTSPEGNYLWTRTIGGNAQTVPNSLAIDSQNQIVICGFIKNLSNLSQGFVRKFNTSNGTNVWTLQIGTFAQGFAEAKSVVVDTANNVFIAGEFNGAIDFDPSGGTDIHDALSGDATASKDAFLSRFTPTGAYVWTRTIGEEGNASGTSLAIDAANNLILAGTFAGTVDFDTDPVNEDIDIAVAGSSAVFVNKWNSDGSYLWSNRYINPGLTDLAYLYRIALDSAGSIYLAFEFKGTMDFDPSAEGVDLINSGGVVNSSALVLSSLFANGSYAWTRIWENLGSFVNDLAVGPDDSLFLCAAGPAIKHYDNNGNPLEALNILGAGGESGLVVPTSVNFRNDGLIALTGRFRQTVDFDPNSGEAVRTSPTAIMQSGFAGFYELLPPAADENANGIPDSCETGIVDSIPAHNRVDARQPFPIQGGPAQGTQSVQLFFSNNVNELTAQDFIISEQGGDGIAPAISNFSHPTDNSVQITFQTPLEPETWTSFTHLPSATSVRFGYLPADANGDGTASSVDILALIDSLNGVTPRPIESTDINRSGVAEPSDILRLIDLLNGAGPYDPYLGRTLPQ